MIALTQTKEFRYLSKLTEDARNFQILFLSSFLSFGIFQLDWDIPLKDITAIIGSCLATQFLWITITTKNYSALKSGLITGLGLSILLNANSISTLIIAGILAISSKFILRIKGKHLFNPANFGIISAIIIGGDAWISPGQWGSNGLFLFALSALGSLILFKIGRLETSITFLVTLFILEYSRTILYQGWSFDVLLHKFSSGTLLLYSFFMITDPMTIPNSKKGRIIWSMILAFSTFILASWMHFYSAPIWILFFITPITVFLDKIYPQVKFEWKKTN